MVTTLPLYLRTSTIANSLALPAQHVLLGITEELLVTSICSNKVSTSGSIPKLLNVAMCMLAALLLFHYILVGVY